MSYLFLQYIYLFNYLFIYIYLFIFIYYFIIIIFIFLYYYSDILKLLLLLQQFFINLFFDIKNIFPTINNLLIICHIINVYLFILIIIYKIF